MLLAILKMSLTGTLYLSGAYLLICLILLLISKSFDGRMLKKAIKNTLMVSLFSFISIYSILMMLNFLIEI